MLHYFIWLTSRPNVTAVTEVRSAQFCKFVKFSRHLMPSWGLLVTIFHSTCIFCVYRTALALYWATVQFYLCVYASFVCRYVVSPWWVLLQHCIMLRLFFIVECGISRSLCAMRVFEVRASSSSPRLSLRQISLFFAVFIAELAHGEKSRTHSFAHSAYLILRCGKRSSRFGVSKQSACRQVVM